MSFVERFERKLESLVNNTFARLFRSDVKPVELRSALERELDNNAQVLSRDSSLAPNAFVVELSPSDHDRLSGYGEALSGDLAKAVEEHAHVEHYELPGSVQVELEPADDLSTGRFRVRSRPIAQTTVRSAREQVARHDQPGAAAHATANSDEPAAYLRAPQQPPSPPRQPAAAHRPSQPAHAPPRPASPDPAAPDPAGEPTRSVPGLRPPAPWVDVNGRRHEMPPPGVLVGRGSDADLQIIDPGVSRRHAEIRVAFIGRRYTVTLHDLGSTNGTEVDGQRTTFATLADGSSVKIGDTMLRVHIPSAATSQG